MTTVFSEAGSVLSAIGRSEKTRDKAIAAGIERHNGKHHDRVQKLLAGCSPEARALVLSHMRKQDEGGDAHARPGHDRHGSESIEVEPPVTDSTSEAGEFLPFGVDPGDSAALLKLRECIDDNLFWPSEQDEQDGNYEAAVVHSGTLARLFVRAKQDDPGPSSGDAAEGNGAEAEPKGTEASTSPQPDQPGSTTWLDAQPPPLTGVIAKDRTEKGRVR